jgi:hypothetical protein
VLEADVEGTRLTLSALALGDVHEPDPPVLVGELLHDGAGVVGGAIVDDQHLVAVGRVVEGEHRLESVADHLALVVGGDQHRHRRVVERDPVDVTLLLRRPQNVEEAGDGEDELVGDHEPDQDDGHNEDDGKVELESGSCHDGRPAAWGRRRTTR